MGALGEEQGHAGGWCTSVMPVVAMVVPGFGALAVAGDTAEKYCSWDQEQVIISNKLLGSKLHVTYIISYVNLYHLHPWTWNPAGHFTSQHGSMAQR